MGKHVATNIWETRYNYYFMRGVEIPRLWLSKKYLKYFDIFLSRCYVTADADASFKLSLIKVQRLEVAPTMKYYGIIFCAEEYFVIHETLIWTAF